MVKNLPASAEDPGSIPGSERSLTGYSPWGCKDTHTDTHTHYNLKPSCPQNNNLISHLKPVNQALYDYNENLGPVGRMDQVYGHFLTPEPLQEYNLLLASE